MTPVDHIGRWQDEFIAVRRIPMNQAGHAVRAVYRVAVPADRLLDLEPRCSELLW